eukprot:m.161181 g.161181  ORF g.161181 m.161181 type:complete len:101 (-) comp16373_c5_seq2:1034-1336(-)
MHLILTLLSVLIFSLSGIFVCILASIKNKRVKAQVDFFPSSKQQERTKEHYVFFRPIFSYTKVDKNTIDSEGVGKKKKGAFIIEKKSHKYTMLIYEQKQN